MESLNGRSGSTGQRWARYLLITSAAGLSLYQLIVAYPGLGAPRTEVHLPVHLALLLTVLFGNSAITAAERGARLKVLIDLSLIATAGAGALYMIVNADAIANRFIFADPLYPIEMVLGFGLILAVLEAARRTIGWVIVVLTLIFFIYAFIGDRLPDPFYHQGFTLERIIELCYLTPEGIWNAPLSVTAYVVFVFVLFGALLIASGAGTFFTDFAHTLSGWTTGGPAKTAVVASALMGMLSGSSAANVVTTGSFTIPAMKKAGYRPAFAAGVEACASCGGQITPPVMGTAAFLMVEFAGISYTDIITYAIMPAFLYFLAVMLMVDLEARRQGLGSSAGSGGTTACAPLLRRGYLLLPVVIMIGFLYNGFTPTAAGFWAVASLAVLTLGLDPANRCRIIPIVMTALTEAPRMMAPVTVACAIGGILAGLITLTGLGVNISRIILDVSGGVILAALVLTMLAGIVLGMGMPTSGAYIVLAALLAPGLFQLGVPEAPAHMFIIYCVSMGALTPPVAIASFAAAAVAGADPWRTCLEGVRLGASVYIIPFMFVYGPSLLGFGTLPEIVATLMTASIGITTLSVAAIGWFWIPLTWYERMLAFAAALCTISTEWMSDIAGLAVIASLVGLLHVRRRNHAPVVSGEAR